MVARVAGAIALLVLAAGAQAQTVADVEQAWRGWMGRNERTSGGLVLLHAGKVAHEAVMGSTQKGAAVPLASLSKAVTAVCVAHLVERGRLSFDTRIAQALAKTLGRIGPPADSRLPDVTLAQLLVHRAGFGRIDADPTTSAALGAYLRTATARQTAFDAQIKWTLARKLPHVPGERFAYTNATYLLLGAVIEEATGRDYEGYCKEAVLTPLGARAAALDPNWRILASYGGWRMPLVDYGRFYQAFADGHPAIGPKARTWMMSPEGKAEGVGSHYALGTTVRPLKEGGANFWHWGSWSYALADAYDGVLRASYATFAARWGGLDVNVVAYMEPRIDPGNARAELDRLLGESIRAVRRWP